MRTSMLLIAIMAITALHEFHINGNQNDEKASHLTLSQVQGSNLGNGRFRKAPGDDPLKSSVSNLQMVARITNAIYLQQGLIAGNIPADELISELLHFGSVKPSDITTLNVADIEDAVKALKELPSKLTPNDNVQKAEASLMHFLDMVKDIKGQANIAKWDRTAFENEIKKLAKDGVNTKSVTDIRVKAAGWDSQIKNPFEDDIPDSEIKGHLNALVRLLDVVKAGSQKLAAAEPYWTSTKFVNVSDGLTPVLLARQASQTYQRLSGELDNHRINAKAYNAYIDSIASHAAPLKSVESTLDVFKRFLGARHTEVSNQKELKFTPGFPRGSSDLAQLDLDLKNLWMEKVTGSKQFPTALEKLRQMEEPIENIHNVLKSKEVVDYGSHITNFAEEVNLVISRSDKGKAGMSIIQTCKSSSIRTPINGDELEKLEKHLKNIDQMLDEMNTETRKLAEYLQNPEIGQLCEQVISICKKAEQAKDLKTVLAELKSYAKMDALNNHMTQIRDLAVAVENIQNAANPQKSTISAEANEAQNLLTYLATYQKEVGSFYGYFSCLQRDDFYTLFDIIEMVKEFRSPNSTRTTSLDDGMKAIMKVAGTKDALKKLETTITSQKGFKSMETDALERLKDGSTHSMTIGLAVQGVSNMKDAVEKRADLEGLVNVKDLIQKHQRWLKDSEDVKNLDSLHSLLDQIQKMITSLDTFKQSIKPSTSSKLADYSDVFMNAKSVSGASGEFEKMAGTVGKLKESVTDPSEKQKLDEVASTLRTMDTMGLDFSKFQQSFDASKGSLSALDDFFLSFANQIKLELERKKEAEEKFLYILIAVGAICLIGSTAGVLAWIRIKRSYIWWRWFSCFRKKFTRDDKLRLVLNHFCTEIDNHAEANKHNWNEEERKTSAWKHYFDTCFQADNGASVAKRSDCMEVNMGETLSNEPLLKATRVKLTGFQKEQFADDYYHASFLRLLNGKKWILCQTPLEGLEGLARLSTVRKFWWMVRQQNTKRIFMMNPLNYGEGHLIQYSPYFPMMEKEVSEFDDTVVTCTKCYHEKKGTSVFLHARELSVAIGNRKPFTVTHYWCTWWNTGAIPRVPFFIADMIDSIMVETKNDSGPPIIHCGDGISESGMVAFVAYCATMVEVDRKVDFQKALKAVRGYRAGVLQNRWSYAFAAILLMEYFDKGREGKVDKDIDEKYKIMSHGFEAMMREAREFKEKKPEEQKLKDGTSKASETGKKEAEGGTGRRKKPEMVCLQEILNDIQKAKIDLPVPPVDPMQNITKWADPVLDSSAKDLQKIAGFERKPDLTASQKKIEKKNLRHQKRILTRRDYCIDETEDKKDDTKQEQKTQELETTTTACDN